MRSPANAIAWQIWTRQRLGLSISTVCLLLMVVAFPPLLLRFNNLVLLVVTLIPAALISAYVANALLFTDEVGSLTSGYPRRMYTLPAPTRTLVFWPMLIAVLVVVALWLAVAILIYQRGGFRPPLVLPALAIAVAMAWLQAICWLPIKSPLVRTYLTLIGLALLLVAPAWLWQREVLSESALFALGLLELAALYALARLGLAHDRRGDDWSFGVDRAVEWVRTKAERTIRQPVRFHTVDAAQDWYESRCHDLLLKGVILFILVQIAAMYLWVPQGKTLAFRIGLGSMLGMPLIMAGSQGASLGRMRPIWSRQRGAITFLSVRPILTGDMVDAKYRLVTRNVVQIWLITLAVSGTLVLVKGQVHDVLEVAGNFFHLYPGWRGWAILGLVIGLTPIVTWKLLTDSLAAVLTGRRWVADGSVLLAAAILMGMVAAVLWYVTHPNLISRHVPIVFWTAAILVIVKLIAVGWVFRLALDRGLLHRYSILRILVCWTVIAFATLMLTHLLIPAGSLPVPRPIALLASLSLLPLARFALAPLALDWNRHR